MQSDLHQPVSIISFSPTSTSRVLLQPKLRLIGSDDSISQLFWGSKRGDATVRLSDDRPEKALRIPAPDRDERCCGSERRQVHDDGEGHTLFGGYVKKP
jgi:hypothetical protein